MDFTSDSLRVGSAGKIGRGVFAAKPFKKGALVERAPLLVIGEPAESYFIERLTVIGSYCYEYDEERICIALGFASLYNHSSRPNADYELFNDRIDIFALRDIKAGDQIKINYNGDPKDRTPIDWEVRRCA